MVMNEKGKSAAQRDANSNMASASAIKIALLVELFDAFGDQLDKPAPLDALMASDSPTVVHFSSKQQQEIQEGLKGKSYRSVGKIMMGTESATNLVYNAAANMAIGLLGGPAEATRRIHQRSNLLDGIVLRRYMLARRDDPGENEVTAASLCQLWKWIAVRQVPGLDAEKLKAIEGATLQGRTRFGVRGQHLYKDGSLDSYPLTRTYAGAVRIGKNEFAYAILLEQPKPTGKAAADEVEKFDAFSLRVANAVLGGRYQ